MSFGHGGSRFPKQNMRKPSHAVLHQSVDAQTLKVQAPNKEVLGILEIGIGVQVLGKYKISIWFVETPDLYTCQFPKIGGLQYRPQNTIILLMGPQNGTLAWALNKNKVHPLYSVCQQGGKPYVH